MPDDTGAPPTPSKQEIYKGTAVSPGIAVGPLLLLYADEHIIRKRRIRPEDVPGEIARFETAPLARRTRAFLTRIFCCLKIRR
jgi:phosphoenolpyruvate-protein kinase (PTS system EI component)